MSPKLKILHLHLSREFAGSETYAASLAKLQAAAGNSVALVVRQSPFVGRWKAEAQGVAVFVIPGWAFGKLGWWVAKHYAKGFNPTLLHSHLGRAHKLGNWLAPRLKIPHIATMHLRYKPAEHAACTALIAIAPWQMDVMPAAIRKRTTLVSNWTETTREEVRPGLRGDDEKEEKVFTFGSVGRLHPQKGMTVLIQAFQQAFPTNQNVRLEIVGEGPERAALEAHRAGDERIVLNGYQANVAPFYARWQGYVSAAVYEPFGLTILEAMAHNLPLVCTRTDGPSWFLKGQPPVHWANLNDAENLAKALKACYAQGGKKVKWDMTPFNPQTALKSIDKIYAGLMLPMKSLKKKA